MATWSITFPSTWPSDLLGGIGVPGRQLPALGRGDALRGPRTGGAQFIYLVLFSYAFFFKGLTGWPLRSIHHYAIRGDAVDRASEVGEKSPRSLIQRQPCLDAEPDHAGCGPALRWGNVAVTSRSGSTRRSFGRSQDSRTGHIRPRSAVVHSVIFRQLNHLYLPAFNGAQLGVFSCTATPPACHPCPPTRLQLLCWWNCPLRDGSFFLSQYQYRSDEQEQNNCLLHKSSRHHSANSSTQSSYQQSPQVSDVNPTRLCARLRSRKPEA